MKDFQINRLKLQVDKKGNFAFLDQDNCLWMGIFTPEEHGEEFNYTITGKVTAGPEGWVGSYIEITGSYNDSALKVKSLNVQ